MYNLALTNIHTRQHKTPMKMTPFTQTFHKGDIVRMLAKRASDHFRKGTLRKWTAEIFNVTAVRRLRNKYVYKLKDENGENIVGTFDDNELQPASSQSVYNFHVLRTRKRNGIKEYYVQWDGFPASANSWIKETDLA